MKTINKKGFAIPFVLFFTMAFVVFVVSFLKDASMKMTLASDKENSLVTYGYAELIVQYGRVLACSYFDIFYTEIIRNKKPLYFSIPEVILQFAPDTKIPLKSSQLCFSTLPVACTKTAKAKHLLITAHVERGNYHSTLQCIISKNTHEKGSVYSLSGYTSSALL